MAAGVYLPHFLNCCKFCETLILLECLKRCSDTYSYFVTFTNFVPYLKFGVLSSQIRVIDAAKYRKIHEEVMKKLDKLENEFLPQVMVDNTEVIFDTIHYLESQARDLIIANTGQVSAHFAGNSRVSRTVPFIVDLWSDVER
jgi:hypothetical protein